MSKSIKAIIASVVSVVLVIVIILGYLAFEIYYNAGILRCEIYTDYIKDNPYYDFKVFGNGRVSVSKFKQPSKSATAIYYADPVTQFAIEDSGERYLSIRERLKAFYLILNLNRLELKDTQILGMVTRVRISFCGKSYIHCYEKPKNLITNADHLANQLINILIKNSPIEVKMW
ncbi:MAG: hypothetical protein BWY15_01567 [Firmicutes bacterium ADurb.Bin193]|nr:MAG: hypothetical protein BWY15_01567 [Firmicutes bacterium ADurb.Bin193]